MLLSTEAKEFQDIYQLGIVSIPTALPVARRDNDDVCFRSQVRICVFVFVCVIEELLPWKNEWFMCHSPPLCA
jgi:hypothetical protein